MTWLRNGTCFISTTSERRKQWKLLTCSKKDKSLLQFIRITLLIGKSKILRVLDREEKKIKNLLLQTQTHHNPELGGTKGAFYACMFYHSTQILLPQCQLFAAFSPVLLVLAQTHEGRQVLGRSAFTQQMIVSMAMRIYGNKNVSIKLIMWKSCS